MNFRDTKPYIIDNCEDVVRGICGLDELLKPPSVEIRARVGLRKQGAATQMEVDGVAAAGSSSQAVLPSSYLVGDELDTAEAAGEDLEISWPLRGAKGWSNWAAIEALWKHTLLSAGSYQRRSNDSPILVTHPATISNASLELLAQTLFERLNVPAVTLIARPLACIFALNAVTGITVDFGQTRTEITPIVESIVQTQATVNMDIGIEHCEIYLANLLSQDAGVLSSFAEAAEVDDQPDPNSTAPSPTSSAPTLEILKRLAKQLWSQNALRPYLLGGQMLTVEQEEEGVTDIAAALVAGKEKALIEAKKESKPSHRSAAQLANDLKKKNAAAALAAANAEADIVSMDFEGRTVNVGKVRHKFCEPLFDPSVLNGLKGIAWEGVPSVQEAIYMAIQSLSPFERLGVWEGVAVTGELSKIRSLPPVLLSHLMPFILSDPDGLSETQPKNTRFLKIPKYFPEYVDEGTWVAPFLGAEIVAKMSFADQSGKMYTTKIQYNLSGPRVIHAPETA